MGTLISRREAPLYSFSNADRHTSCLAELGLDLRRRLKQHCVAHEITLQDFVVEAIQEKLGRKGEAEEGDGLARAANAARGVRRLRSEHP